MQSHFGLLIFITVLASFAKAGLEDGISSFAEVMRAVTSVGKTDEYKQQRDAELAKIRNNARELRANASRNTAGHFSKMGDGVKKFSKGWKADDGVTMTIGSLDIASSALDIGKEILDLNPLDPKKMKLKGKLEILQHVLTLISFIVGLIGGFVGNQETCEGMIKRVVEKALTDAKVFELRSEVNGIKRYYGAFTNAIQEFREQKNVPDEQAREFFVKSYDGLVFFGRLEHFIGKWCEIGDTTSMEKNAIEEKVKRCLTLCNLYADLSIIRQTLLLELSAFLAECGKPALSADVLKLINEDQKADENIFKFLVDPIDYKNKRPLHSYLYSKIGSYTTLYAYLQRLHEAKKDEKEDSSYFVNMVMMCDKDSLKGNCYAYRNTTYNPNLWGWNDKIRSVYVSGNRKLYAYEDMYRRGKRYGPYYGPSVFSTIPGDETWTSLVIYQTAYNSTRMVRICDKAYNDVTAKCALILPQGSYNNLKDVSGENWQKKVESVEIPSGIKVTGYASRDYGPFYGPQTINKINPVQWTHIKAELDDSHTSGTVIKVCRAKYLNDICCDVTPPSGIGKLSAKRMNTNRLCGYEFGTQGKKIESIKVPAGLIVQLFSGSNLSGRRYGPYTGPTTIDEVDGAAGYYDVIRSINIIKLY